MYWENESSGAFWKSSNDFFISFYEHIFRWMFGKVCANIYAISNMKN
jgi:hypothetical protein